MTMIRIQLICYGFFINFVFGAAYAAPEVRSFFEVTLSQTNYQGQPQIVEQDKQYSSISPAFQFYRQRGSIEGQHGIFFADGFAVIPMSDGVDSGVAIPDLYYQEVFLPKLFSLSVGRKKENWSELDRYWSLGLWQSLVRWDGAHPVEQGLTGVFVDFGSKDSMRFVLFGSGVFLPDQQPDYKEKDGRIVSPNRWFRAPVATIGLERGRGDIIYDINEPSSEDVIRQESWAAMIQFGDEDAGLLFRASYANKPMNQFHIAMNPEALFELEQGNAYVPVYPMSLRHELRSFELGHRGPDYRIMISRNYEFYETPRVSGEWLQTALSDSHYDGVVYTQSLSRLGFKRTDIGLSYVKRTLTGDEKKSTLIKGDIETSAQRFQFEEMAGVQLTANLIRTFKRELDTHFKYVYSVGDHGEWIQAGVRYTLDRQWAWALSADVLGVPGDQPAGSSFISMFRGNDRVMGSMTYVF